MLSVVVLKQLSTYLKSQVGHGWSVEGIKYSFSIKFLNNKKSSDLLFLGRAPMSLFDNKAYVCGSTSGAFHCWNKILLS